MTCLASAVGACDVVLACSIDAILAIKLTVQKRLSWMLVEQGDCTPACAVAIHSFTNDCMDTLNIM